MNAERLRTVLTVLWRVTVARMTLGVFRWSFEQVYRVNTLKDWYDSL